MVAVMDESQDIESHLEGVTELISKFEQNQIRRHRDQATTKLALFCIDMDHLDVDRSSISHILNTDLLATLDTEESIDRLSIDQSIFRRALIDLNSISVRYREKNND